MTSTKCRGDCDRPGYDFVKSSSYRDGELNYCSICISYVNKSHTKCPCCNGKLRNKPKDPRDKRTKEGDESLVFFDIVVMNVNNDFKKLRKCYKFPKLGDQIIDVLFSHFYEVLRQYARIEEKKRQRPDYLHAKTRMMEKLVCKLRRELSLFRKNTVYS